MNIQIFNRTMHLFDVLDKNYPNSSLNDQETDGIITVDLISTIHSYDSTYNWIHFSHKKESQLMSSLEICFCREDTSTYFSIPSVFSNGFANYTYESKKFDTQNKLYKAIQRLQLEGLKFLDKKSDRIMELLLNLELKLI